MTSFLMRSILFLAALAGFSGIFAQNNLSPVQSRLKKDIQYLASDELEGRLAGSEGERKATDYIIAQMKAAGLKPVNGEWLQTFHIVQLRLATAECQFAFKPDLPGVDEFTFAKLHEEFYPLSESSNADSVLAPIVQVGYGIEADALGHNDYKDKDSLKGKIFMIVLGFPGDDANAHSKLAEYADYRLKISKAIEKGAAGIIFVPGSAKAEIPKGELQRNANTLSIPVVFFKHALPPHPTFIGKLKTTIAAPSTNARNVVGFKNNHKKRTVIVCAHHDHLGYNEYGNSRYTGPLAIHNGADDNASGVAAMLELARSMKGRKYRKNNYLFIAFSAEELGLLGSKFFIKNSPVELKNINYVINIDMLGRIDSAKQSLMIYGTGTSPVWEPVFTKTKHDTTTLKLVKSASGLGPSDHASFYLENIPVLHFFSGQHADYHKPSDDEDKINYDGMEKSLNFIQSVVKAGNKSGKFPFTKTKDEQPGGRKAFKVSMGIMPDYSFSGNGLMVDGVSEGKPAQAAGLQRGDVIVKLGDFNIGNVQDYMAALQQLDKGQTVPVVVKRGSEEITLKVTF